MKYDKELFELSDYFKTVNKHEKDSKDTEIKKRKLFRLILDKFRQSKPEGGVFKVKFAESDNPHDNKGYLLIKELVEKDVFSSFTNDYLIYISRVHYGLDNIISSYYELTWNYQAYFEFMEYHRILGKLMDMPEDTRNIAIKSIHNMLMDTKLKEKDFCKHAGHNVRRWVKIDNENSSFWYGTCTRCGETRITRKNPNGISLERNKK